MTRLRPLITVIAGTALLTAGGGVFYLMEYDGRDEERAPATSAPDKITAVPTLPAGRPDWSPGDTVPADLMAVTPRRLTEEGVKGIKEAKGVKEVAVVGGGTVSTAGKQLRLLAVDPGRFRAWTPPVTAKAEPLWEAVDRGELVLSVDSVAQLGVEVGAEYPVGGLADSSAPRLRVGAAAPLNLPGVDGVVNLDTGDRLGLRPDVAALVNAPKAEIGTLLKSLKKRLGKGAQLVALREQKGKETGRAPKRKATGYLDLYRQAAATCPGLSWTVLAAIGQIESGHGRNNGPSSAGALGPMQFMPGTWRRYRVDGDGDGKADIMNPYDAIPAAAKYLCASGAGRGGESLRRAIYAYNHSWSYVERVLGLARAYEQAYS